MKLILFVMIFVWTQVTRAQTKLKINSEHQLEYGINYVNFMNKNTELNGLGLFYSDGIYWGGNYYFGYKAILNHKHLIKLNMLNFESSLSYPNYPNLGLLGLHFKTFNLGYNYCLPIKHFPISLGVLLSYKYGGETAVFGYRNIPPLTEPVEAKLEYSSFGFSPNAEIEYFITKNLGFGVNLNLNYYPFENAKLKGDGTNEPDPLFVQIYKPNNLNFTATFKLAYKFSFHKL